MTLLNEAELDRLRDPSIKNYNPAVNSLIKTRAKSFKVLMRPSCLTRKSLKENNRYISTNSKKEIDFDRTQIHACNFPDL